MRPRTAILPSLLLSLVVSFGGPGAAVLPDPAERWIELRTAHFTLYSNASESYTTEIGRRLEEFRDTLSRLVSGLEVNSPAPTSVYVFKHDASFAPYKKRVGAGPANISGAFAAHRDGNYVALDATPPTDPWAVIHHEYVHFFLSNNFTNVPLWFNEGAAEVFSTYRSASGKAEIGRPIDGHVDHLASRRWISFPDLFLVDEDSKDYNTGDRQGTFYAESWALVHYLAWGPSTTKARGVDFFAQFPQRSDLRQALAPILGPDWGALQARVAEYLRKRRLTYSVVDLAAAAADPSAAVRPMSRAEALARLGEYLTHTQPERLAEAQAHFEAAIAADPGHAPAYTGLGYLRDLQKRREEAAGYYEKALALAPDDPMTLFLFAESLVDRTIPPGAVTRRAELGPTSPDLARARALYRRAIRLRPGVGEVYAGLGATFMFDAGDLKEGIEALETARRLLPSRMDIALNLAGLYARSGDRVRARDLVERVLEPSGEDDLIRTGRDTLLDADVQEAQSRINKGEVDAGIALLEEVRSKTGDAALKASIDKELARIAEVRVLQGQIESFNRAVALANKGDTKKATALLERLAVEVKDAKLAEQVRTALKRLRDIQSAGKP